MDTMTAPQVAQGLGISLATAHAWLDDADVPRTGKGVDRLVPVTVVKKVVGKHGAVPTQCQGLSRTQLLLVAAIARSPLGISSARRAARLISASPNVVAHDIKTLEEREIVCHVTRNTIKEGRVVEQSYITISASAPMDIISAARKVTLPDAPSITRGETVVPKRFTHHFWNVDPVALDSASGSFIAGRLLGSDDVAAWAWALAALPREDIKTAMSRRGVPNSVKAVAEAWEKNAE